MHQKHYVLISQSTTANITKLQTIKCRAKLQVSLKVIKKDRRNFGSHQPKTNLPQIRSHLVQLSRYKQDFFFLVPQNSLMGLGTVFSLLCDTSITWLPSAKKEWGNIIHDRANRLLVNKHTSTTEDLCSIWKLAESCN